MRAIAETVEATAKARPILFKAPMIRAILDGTKTQTRRIVRSHVSGVRSDPVSTEAVLYWDRGVEDPRRWVGRDGLAVGHVYCPYGEPGDRLWVKEAVRRLPDDGSHLDSAIYIADGSLTPLESWPWKLKALPGMYMPLGLSRITLEVTGVRVERLQAITEEDAKAEGITTSQSATINGKPGVVHNFGPDAHRQAFAQLWDGINGERASWASNPWTWVVSFRRVKP